MRQGFYIRRRAIDRRSCEQTVARCRDVPSDLPEVTEEASAATMVTATTCSSRKQHCLKAEQHRKPLHGWVHERSSFKRSCVRRQHPVAVLNTESLAECLTLNSARYSRLPKMQLPSIDFPDPATPTITAIGGRTGWCCRTFFFGIFVKWTPDGNPVGTAGPGIKTWLTAEARCLDGYISCRVSASQMLGVVAETEKQAATARMRVERERIKGKENSGPAYRGNTENRLSGPCIFGGRASRSSCER